MVSTTINLRPIGVACSSTVFYPPFPSGGWAMTTVLTVQRGWAYGWLVVLTTIWAYGLAFGTRPTSPTVGYGCQPYYQPFRVLPAVF